MRRKSSSPSTNSRRATLGQRHPGRVGGVTACHRAAASVAPRSRRSRGSRSGARARCARPIRGDGPHRTLSPVSSRTSRSTAAATGLTRARRGPRARSTAPPAGAMARRTRRRRAVAHRHAPTASTAGTATGPAGGGAHGRVAVHGDEARLETRRLEEALRGAVAGQGADVHTPASRRARTTPAGRRAAPAPTPTPRASGST